jgi:hypothetical protein
MKNGGCVRAGRRTGEVGLGAVPPGARGHISCIGSVEVTELLERKSGLDASLTAEAIEAFRVPPGRVHIIRSMLTKQAVLIHSVFLSGSNVLNLESWSSAIASASMRWSATTSRML